MKVIFSQECLGYTSPGHPESPERVRLCYEELLANKKTLPIEFIAPKPCAEGDILLAHTKELLEKVRNEDFFDPDTPQIPNILEHTLLSAGAACMAADHALKNKELTFSLMRPPGHHAGRNSLGGFCYFNNIAIAISKSLKNIKKAAILDLDCHHGNGTENIFLGTSNVLFTSLHQSPLYPGTGTASRENCKNFPLSAGTDEQLYLATLKLAIKEIKDFKPELLGISIGFDTYKDDPLTHIHLEESSYCKISQAVSKLNIPAFAVLEGGYSNGIGRCLFEFLKGWESK